MKLDSPKKIKKRWLHFLIIVILVALAWWGYHAWPKPHYKAVHNFDECELADYTVNDADPPVCTDPQGHKFTQAVAATPPALAQTALDFDTLVSSTNGPLKPERAVITNQLDWQAFWQRTHAHLGTMPNIIPVDFSQKEVIAVVDGRHDSAGYYTKIEEVAQQGDIVLATIHESTPPAGCIVPGGPISPYHIIQIDKTSLPVRFSVTTTTLDTNCRPKA